MFELLLDLICNEYLLTQSGLTETKIITGSPIGGLNSFADRVREILGLKNLQHKMYDSYQNLYTYHIL